MDPTIIIEVVLNFTGILHRKSVVPMMTLNSNQINGE